MQGHTDLIKLGLVTCVESASPDVRWISQASHVSYAESREQIVITKKKPITIRPLLMAPIPRDGPSIIPVKAFLLARSASVPPTAIRLPVVHEKVPLPYPARVP